MWQSPTFTLCVSLSFGQSFWGTVLCYEAENFNGQIYFQGSPIPHICSKNGKILMEEGEMSKILLKISGEIREFFLK